jgi:hypothetical protein
MERLSGTSLVSGGDAVWKADAKMAESFAFLFQFTICDRFRKTASAFESTLPLGI